MYALSLDDPRLVLPVPVYEVKDPSGKAEYLTGESISATRAWDHVQRVAFFAAPPDRHREGLVPIASLPADAATTRSTTLRVAPSLDAHDASRIVFLALPPDPAPDLPVAVPLFEYRQAATGKRFYAAQPDSPMRDAERVGKPVCYVWRSPVKTLYLASDTHPVDAR
jgi:hypothetical protein